MDVGDVDKGISVGVSVVCTDCCGGFFQALLNFSQSALLRPMCFPSGPIQSVPKDVFTGGVLLDGRDVISSTQFNVKGKVINKIPATASQPTRGLSNL